MVRRRRGFAALNAKSDEQDGQDQQTENIEAVESRLAQQFRQAEQAILQGDTATATPLLLQLFNEPLLQPAAVQHAPAGATARAGAAVGSPSPAQQRKQHQQQQILQSRTLQGMRPRILLSLAPLLGQTQKALEVWAEALSHDPLNPKIWEEISIVLAHLGHLRLAVQAADRAVGLKPSDITLHELLAVLLAACQDWDGAGAVLTRLADLGYHPWVLNLPSPAPSSFTAEQIQACIPNIDMHVAFLAQQHCTQLQFCKPRKQPVIHQHQLITGTDQGPGSSAGAGAVAATAALPPITGDILLWEVDSLQEMLQLLVQVMTKHYEPCEDASSSSSRPSSGNSSSGKPAVISSPVKSPARALAAAAAVAAGAGGSPPAAPTGAAAGMEGRSGPLKRICVRLPATAEQAAHDHGPVQQHQQQQQQQQQQMPHESDVDMQGAAATDTTTASRPVQAGARAKDSAPRQHQQEPAAVEHSAVGGQQAQQEQQQQGQLQGLGQQAQEHAGAAHQQHEDEHSDLPHTDDHQAAAAGAGAASGHGRSKGAGSGGRLRGRPPGSKPAGAHGHGHHHKTHSHKAAVVTPGEVVQALVGVWLQPAAGAENAAESGLPGAAATAAAAAAAAAGAAVTGVMLPQPAQQPQPQANGCLLQQQPPQQQQPQQHQQHQQQVPADTWQQHEQEVLANLAQLGPIWPKELTQHVMQALLPVLDAVAVPAACAALLLKLSSHLSSNSLTPQQHLLLAELHLDAALQLQSGKKPASTGSKAKAAAAAAETYVAAAGSGSVGARKRGLAAAAGGPSETAAEPAAPAAAAAGGAPGSEADGTASGAAKRRRVTAAAAAAGTAAPTATRRQLQLQRPAATGSGAAAAATGASNRAADAGAGATTGGSKAAVRKQAHAEAAALAQQQQLELHWEVSAHLEACEQHMQQRRAVEARGSFLQSASPYHLGAVKYTLQLPVEEAGVDTVADLDTGDDSSDVRVFLQALGNLRKQIWEQQCGEGQPQHALEDHVPTAAAAATAGSNGGRRHAAQQATGPVAAVVAPKQPSVLWDPSGPVVNLGQQRFVGLRPFLPRVDTASQAGNEGQQQQQQEQQDSPSSRFAPWMQQMLNNSIFSGEAQQHSSNSSSNVPLDADAAVALGADQAPAADAVSEADLQVEVRRHWVYSRLLQAQGRLAEADAQGKACLQALEDLSQLVLQQEQRHPAGTQQPDQQPGQLAVHPERQQGQRIAQQGQQQVSVTLPNCALDSTIDASSVWQKLDQMWLSMQLLAAEQQLRDVEAAMRQVQLACKAVEQQQQHAEESVQFDAVLQSVQQVHAGADSVLKVLSPRCLVDAGDLSGQKLSGVALLQKAAQFAAAAATAALKLAVSCADSNMQARRQQQQLQQLRLQQQQQHYRCVYLRCILLRLQYAVQQHCRSASATAAGSVAAAAHARVRGSSNTAEAVQGCLQELIQFWQGIVKPKPQPVAVPAPAAARIVAGAAVAGQHGQAAAAAAAGGAAEKADQNGSDDSSSSGSDESMGAADGPSLQEATSGGGQQPQTNAATTAQQRQQQDQWQKEAEQLQKAAAAAEAAAALGSAACAAEVLQLQSHPEVLTLLRQVQRSLLLLLSASAPTLTVPVVAPAAGEGQGASKGAAAAAAAAAGAANTAAADAAAHAAGAANTAAADAAAHADGAAVQLQLLAPNHSMDSIALNLRRSLTAAAAREAADSMQGGAAAAADATGPAAAAAVRASKRARHITAAVAEAAQQGYRVGSKALPAAGASGGVAGRGAAAAAAGAAGLGARSGGRTRRGLSLQSSRDKHLMMDAGIGALAVQDLDPQAGKDSSRVYGLVEGLYCLVGLRLDDAADSQVCRFLQAAWERLTVLLHRGLVAAAQQGAASAAAAAGAAAVAAAAADGGGGSSAPQGLAAGCVDGALGALLHDLYGLSVPWRHAAFGRTPLVLLLASKTAGAAAAADSATSAADTAVASLADSAAAAAAAAAALQVALSLPARAAHVAAAAGDAAEGLSIHALLKQGLFKPRVLSGSSELPDLLRAWQYVVLDVSSRQLLLAPAVTPTPTDTPRASDSVEVGAAATGAGGVAGLPIGKASSRAAVKGQLLAAAVEAAAAVLQPQAASGGPAEAAHAPAGASLVTAFPAAITAAGSVAAGHAGGAAVNGGHAPAAAVQAGAAAHKAIPEENSEEELSSDSEEDETELQVDDDGDSLCAQQRLYWQRLRPLLLQLKQRLPPPPPDVLTVASARVADVLGSAQPAAEVTEAAAGPAAPATAADSSETEADRGSQGAQQSLPAAAAAAAAATTARAAAGTARDVGLQQQDSQGSIRSGSMGAEGDGDVTMQDAQPFSPQPAAGAAAAAAAAAAGMAVGTLGSRSPSLTNLPAAAAPATAAVADRAESPELPADVLQEGSPAPTAVDSLYGWSETDMQLVLEGRAFDTWCKQGPSAADQAAVDPLWQLHGQLSQALLLAAPPRLNEAAAFGPEGLKEVEGIEAGLMQDIAVRPDSAEAWAYLAHLYLDSFRDLSQEDLLTEAAGMAPVSAWRKAAAAAAATAPASALQHQRRSSSSREGSSSPRDQGSGALRQEVQILWQMGRKALRATVIAIHLLQQQQQQQGIVPSSTAGAGAGTAAVLPKQYRPGLGAVAYRKEALLNHLGVTLLDQASCLSPWFEPWRFRPQRTPLRLLMLDAAKACFSQSMHAEAEWQNHLALGSITSKVQQPGWQAVTLAQYAHACYTSRAGPEGAFSQPARLLPLVKLHGKRLKLLARLVGPAAAAGGGGGGGGGGGDAAGGGEGGVSAPQQPPAAAAASGQKGVLEGLLETLELLSKWCWDTAKGTKLRQELLPALRQQLQVAAAVSGVVEDRQEQQQKMEQLRANLQQHWHVADVASTSANLDGAAPAVGGELDRAGSGGNFSTTPTRRSRRGQDVAQWQEAVVLLAEDGIEALQFCSGCCTRPLGPACYSLAKGLFMLDRVGPALSSLEQLFRPTGSPTSHPTAPTTSSTPSAPGTAAPSTPQLSATQLAAQAPLVLSIAFLEEKGGIKAAYTEQHAGGGSGSARTPGRQQRRLSKKRQLDSLETPLGQPHEQQTGDGHQQQQQQGKPGQNGLGASEGAGGAGASGGGRKRRRISTTAAAHEHSASRAAGSAAAAAGSVSAQACGPPADAGSKPAAVCGWGVEEGPREFSCRTRRRLLLYIKLLYLKRDAAGLVSVWQGLLGPEGDGKRQNRRAHQIRDPGFDPRDLGELAAALHLRLLLESLGPVLLEFAAVWVRQQQDQQRQQELARQSLAAAAGPAAGAAAAGAAGNVGPVEAVDSIAAEPAQAIADGAAVAAGQAPAAEVDAVMYDPGKVLSALHLSDSNRDQKLQLFLQTMREYAAASTSNSSSSDADVSNRGQTPSLRSPSPAQPAGSEAAAAAASQQQQQQRKQQGLQLQLADAFELFAVYLQLALTPGQHPLQLSKLLRYAEELITQDPAAAAAAAVAAAAAAGTQQGVGQGSGGGAGSSGGGAGATAVPIRAETVLFSLSPRYKTRLQEQQQAQQWAQQVQRLGQALQKQTHAAEQLLYFLAAAHVDQQQQQQAADASTPAATTAAAATSAAPAAAAALATVPPSEGLREAAKTLKAYFKSLTLRSLSLDTQLQANMAKGLCKQVLSGLLVQQQQQLEAARARVTSLLTPEQMSQLSALQVAEQPTVDMPSSQLGAAAAAAAGGVPGGGEGVSVTPDKQQQQQQQQKQGANTMDVDVGGSAAATPAATAILAARQGSEPGDMMSPPAAAGAAAAGAAAGGALAQAGGAAEAARLLRGGRVTRSTPPPTPSALTAAAGGPGAAPEQTPRRLSTPAGAAAAAAAAGDGVEGVAAGRDVSQTPGLPPSGLQAEGRRAPRAAALAGKDKIVQSLGSTFAGAAAGSASGAAAAAAAVGAASAGKVRIIPLPAGQVSALQLLQQVLKSLQELVKGQYGQLAAGNSQARQYKSRLFELVWEGVKLAAAAAGVTAEALAGSSSAPTAEKKADDMLKAALGNVGGLLEGCVLERLVADSRAAVQGPTGPQQQQQQQQQEGEGEVVQTQQQQQQLQEEVLPTMPQQQPQQGEVLPTKQQSAGVPQPVHPGLATDTRAPVPAAALTSQQQALQQLLVQQQQLQQQLAARQQVSQQQPGQQPAQLVSPPRPPGGPHFVPAAAAAAAGVVPRPAQLLSPPRPAGAQTPGVLAARPQHAGVLRQLPQLLLVPAQAVLPVPLQQAAIAWQQQMQQRGLTLEQQRQYLQTVSAQRQQQQRQAAAPAAVVVPAVRPPTSPPQQQQQQQQQQQPTQLQAYLMQLWQDIISAPVDQRSQMVHNLPEDVSQALFGMLNPAAAGTAAPVPATAGAAAPAAIAAAGVGQAPGGAGTPVAFRPQANLAGLIAMQRPMQQQQQQQRLHGHTGAPVQVLAAAVAAAGRSEPLQARQQQQPGLDLGQAATAVISAQQQQPAAQQPPQPVTAAAAAAAAAAAPAAPAGNGATGGGVSPGPSPPEGTVLSPKPKRRRTMSPGNDLLAHVKEKLTSPSP